MSDNQKYKAELYDEVWQKATGMGYMNVTIALEAVAALREELAAQKETVALFESEYSKQSVSLAAAEQNSQRYRGIRDILTIDELAEVTANCQTGDEWDAAVDAALAQPTESGASE